MTALQRLRHLRLVNCVTDPLTCISRLTQLTSLEVLQDLWQELDTLDNFQLLVRWVSSNCIAAAAGVLCRMHHGIA
jgi:hypothetical protein